MDDAPFFVIGAQRSGTTLLRLMLAAHPRLIIPPESHFIPDLYRFEQRFGGLERRRAEVAHLLANHDRLVDFGLGAEWISSLVWSLGPLTTKTVTEAIFEQYARLHGKARWGDKTPRYRSFVPELRSIFPESRFIHLVRDGRDTALSAWKADFGPRTWVGAAYLWRDSVRAAARSGRELPPGAFCEIRYEDLLADPRATLERVCAFLGETFHEDMLRHSEIAGALVPSWERSWHATLDRPIKSDNAGKWRQQLSARQIELFERVAGAELEQFGYPLARMKLGVTSRASIHGMRALHHVVVTAGHVKSVFESHPPLAPTAYRPAKAAVAV